MFKIQRNETKRKKKTMSIVENSQPLIKQIETIRFSWRKIFATHIFKCSKS